MGERGGEGRERKIDEKGCGPGYMGEEMRTNAIR